jgi:putative flippase GtrA
MDQTPPPRRSKPWLFKYCGVSLIGFGVDLALVHGLVRLGLEPAWARVISLLCAMHVTFALNRLHVFRQAGRSGLPGQWARYMLCNGFGNVCNYWIFVTLVSLHWRWVSTPAFAVAAGSVAAWLINLAATRLVVFPPRGDRPGPPWRRGHDPSPAAPESPPR